MATSRLNGLSRRNWLKVSTLGTGKAIAAGGLANLLLPATSAHAADYKALVCVFLYGGNDGLNTIVPTDSRYTQYSSVRKNLALPLSSLLPLSGTAYGLHPALSALQPAWRDGRLAPVFNVGPLQRPLTRESYLAAPPNSPTVPESLYSHADQQVLWESATSNSYTRTGWGGRAAAVMGNTNPVFSVGGTGRFGLSADTVPVVIPAPGSMFGSHELSNDPWRLQYAPLIARANALRSMYRQNQRSDLAEAYAKVQRDAYEASTRLAAIVRTQPGASSANAAIDAGFAPLISNGTISSSLGQQLYQAAKLIANNTVVQGTRQIFFAQLGGFDVHRNQISSGPTVGNHADLLRQLGGALAAFDAAMKNLGLSDAVTTFTQSDFGRTFKPNNSNGTDHAWGNNQLVLGGAVKGNATYGVYPQLELGGADDAGTDGGQLVGRWIPTSSVDQYAATLLKWFGANDSQLNTILPNLTNFGTKRTLGFV